MENTAPVFFDTPLYVPRRTLNCYCSAEMLSRLASTIRTSIKSCARLQLLLVRLESASEEINLSQSLAKHHSTFVSARYPALNFSISDQHQEIIGGAINF